jgi:hypothetical protein
VNGASIGFEDGGRGQQIVCPTVLKEARRESKEGEEGDKGDERKGRRKKGEEGKEEEKLESTDHEMRR